MAQHDPEGRCWGPSLWYDSGFADGFQEAADGEGTPPIPPTWSGSDHNIAYLRGRWHGYNAYLLEHADYRLPPEGDYRRIWEEGRL